MSKILRILLTAGLLLSPLAACHDRAPAPSPRPAPDAIYTVRGRVEDLPAKDRPLAEFVVKHEPIDTFKNPDGTLGMDTMSMPFPTAAGVDLTGLATGDAIEMELAVWTTPGHRGYEARKITKLPASIDLHFGKAPHASPLPSPTR